MDDVVLRLGYLVRALVPFLFMMATVYLATHVLFARLIASRQSQVLSFFSIVTAPLTRPFRAVLPRDTSEPRLRLVALITYLVLWLVTDRLLRGAAAGGA